jgi:hypothetical protein
LHPHSDPCRILVWETFSKVIVVCPSLAIGGNLIGKTSGPGLLRSSFFGLVFSSVLAALSVFCSSAGHCILSCGVVSVSHKSHHCRHLCRCPWLGISRSAMKRSERVCYYTVQIIQSKFRGAAEGRKDERMWREVHVVLGYLKGRGGWMPDRFLLALRYDVGYFAIVFCNR